MLRGRYGIGWMLAAWAALAVAAIGIAIWLGPVLAKIMANGSA